jgi:hypothetical protein
MESEMLKLGQVFRTVQVFTTVSPGETCWLIKRPVSAVGRSHPHGSCRVRQFDLRLGRLRHF